LKTFESALSSKDFVVTSEILLAPQFGDEHIGEQAKRLRGHVDAILLTDNQSGRLHMSSLAASSLVRQAGIDPIMQLGCRNRNRISLLGDLLGASALGIRNLQLVRGERIPDGFVPRPKAVLDVTATELIAIASKMKQEDGIASIPDLILGGIVSPRAPSRRWRAKKLLQKVDAGARFLMTHTCMDIGVVKTFMDHLVSLGIPRRTNMIVTVAVLGSAQDARWLRDNRTNVMIPDSMIDMLAADPQPREKGIDIAAELLQQLVDVPGIAGAHIYSPNDVNAVVETIRRAGPMANPAH
jgi:methylenetetrahydrofolate reductase (NADH)